MARHLGKQIWSAFTFAADIEHHARALGISVFRPNTAPRTAITRLNNHGACVTLATVSIQLQKAAMGHSVVLPVERFGCLHDVRQPSNVTNFNGIPTLTNSIAPY